MAPLQPLLPMGKSTKAPGPGAAEGDICPTSHWSALGAPQSGTAPRERHSHQPEKVIYFYKAKEVLVATQRGSSTAHSVPVPPAIAKSLSCLVLTVSV